ncbi:MAG: hypothetical protein ACRYFX_05195 [Janthinobacterium lividum]
MAAYSESRAQIPPATLASQALDRATRQPLGFVSVGVLGKPYGTVADAQGRFALNLPASFDADSVRLSLVGYANRTLRVADLRHTGPVLLRAQTVALAGVQVRAKGLKRRVRGNAGTPMRFDGFAANMAGNQIGQLLAIKKPAFLEEISLRLFSCTYDTVYFRLNVYKLRDGYPADNILPTSVYFKVSREQAQETIYLNLRRYHLYLTESVVMALELVRQLGQGELWFRQPLAGGGPHYVLEQMPGPSTTLNTVPPSTDTHDQKIPQPNGPWTQYPHIGVGIQATLLEVPE